jgi:predicted Fe-Mo cluster-binding NifX family protein
MKIAVTSQGKGLGSRVDPRFGRAAYILIVNTDTWDFDVLDNKENVNALQGAGIQAATNIFSKGAEVLLTGFCGPNAFKTLNAAGVKVANGASGTVIEAIKAFMKEEMPLSDSPNAEGHW